MSAFTLVCIVGARVSDVTARARRPGENNFFNLSWQQQFLVYELNFSLSGSDFCLLSNETIT